MGRTFVMPPPFVVSPNSIIILSFFYIYLFWNFHVSSVNGWKVWILEDLIEQCWALLIGPSNQQIADSRFRFVDLQTNFFLQTFADLR